VSVSNSGHHAKSLSFTANRFLYSTSKQSANTVTFTRNKGSQDAGSLDASATFNIVSSNFRAYNINFRNTYGTQGQAVAVAANGDRQGYYACGFYGYQDTLYAKSGRQYYSNCYVEGAVDYIFGNAAAWFGECTVASNGAGYITASSRSTADDNGWYVFDHSAVSLLPLTPYSLPIPNTASPHPLSARRWQ
jgi:pectinesterase